MITTILDGLFIMKEKGSEMLRSIEKDEFIHFIIDSQETSTFVNEIIEMENYGDQTINVFTKLLSDDVFFNQFKMYQIYERNSDVFYLLPANELEVLLELANSIDCKKYAKYFNENEDCYSYVNESLICQQLSSFVNILSVAMQKKKCVLFAFKLIV